MVDDRAKVLLIVPADVLDRARVVAGKSTIALKLPVSLQIVLRALIEEGLKREGYPGLTANIEGQAKAMRLRRSMARQVTTDGKGRRRR
jgi:Mn-dependent DtxR family transcriptional regulator